MGAATSSRNFKSLGIMFFEAVEPMGSYLINTTLKGIYDEVPPIMTSALACALELAG